MNISVLMSVYKDDCPDALGIALRSIWDDQTYKPDQIILVQDGPLNYDLDLVINKFISRSDTSIDSIKLDKNHGLAFALNEGLKACKCEFIARMDADDISLPDRFQKQIDFLMANENVDVLGGAIEEFEDLQSSKSFIRSYPRTHLAVKKSIPYGSPVAHPAVMFRRSIILAGHRYKDDLKKSQDVEFWFRLIANGYKINNLPDILLKFRINKNFASRRSIGKAQNELFIYWRGLYVIYGFGMHMIPPLLRFMFRMLPNNLIMSLYKSNLRGFLNKF